MRCVWFCDCRVNAAKPSKSNRASNSVVESFNYKLQLQQLNYRALLPENLSLSLSIGLNCFVSVFFCSKPSIYLFSLFHFENVFHEWFGDSWFCFYLTWAHPHKHSTSITIFRLNFFLVLVFYRSKPYGINNELECICCCG